MLIYGFRALHKQLIETTLEDSKRLITSDYDLIVSLNLLKVRIKHLHHCLELI